MREYLKPGVWQHYKGGMYTVFGVGKHTESGQLLVHYQGADGDLWSRPLAMWFDSVEYNDNIVPRFSKVKKPERKLSNEIS